MRARKREGTGQVTERKERRGGQIPTITNTYSHIIVIQNISKCESNRNAMPKQHANLK